jgi:hypothetical protein
MFLTGTSGWKMTQNGNPIGNGGQYFGDSVRDKDEFANVKDRGLKK